MGLDLPKPLFEVLPGLRLIDLTLHHLQAAVERGIPFDVVVVTNPRTQVVCEYVRSVLKDRLVRSCPFNDRFREWPGSVFSASSFFGESNMVLLPDSRLSLNTDSPCLDADGHCALELMERGLMSKPVHFLVVAEHSSRLKSLGALLVKEGRVLRLDDKPRVNWSRYNAFWAAYGFRYSHGSALFRFLDALVAHCPPPLSLEDLGPPGATWIDSYQDLGTWDALNAFRRRFQGPGELSGSV